MPEAVLELEKREIVGKAVKNLRKEGIVPGVIHDHGKPSIIVSAEYQQLHKTYQNAGKHQPVRLKAGGKTYTAMIKTVAINPRHNSIDHVVFNAIKANEKVTTEIPVKIKLDEENEVTPAERAGLIVLHNQTTVEVEALPNKLPDVIEFDGEKLVEVGDHASVADLIVPEGVEIKTDAGQTLASVFEPSALAAANDAAGGDADDEASEEEGDSEASEGTAEAASEEASEPAKEGEQKADAAADADAKKE